MHAARAFAEFTSIELIVAMLLWIPCVHLEVNWLFAPLAQPGSYCCAARAAERGQRREAPAAADWVSAHPRGYLHNRIVAAPHIAYNWRRSPGATRLL